MFPGGGIPSGTSPLQLGMGPGGTPATTASGVHAEPKALMVGSNHQALSAHESGKQQQQQLQGMMGLSSNGGGSSAPQPGAPDASQPKAHNVLDPAFLSAFLPNASGVGAAMHPGLAFNFASSQGFGSSAKEDEGCAPPSNGQRALDAARDAAKVVEDTWQRYMVR